MSSRAPLTDMTWKSPFNVNYESGREEMRGYFFAGLVLLLIQWTSAENDPSTDLVSNSDARVKMIVMAGRRLRDLWTKYIAQREQKDTFVGRCIGLAKKMRQLMPILIFKMGVIMTLLAFLTLFSLKSLGMLAILLLINTSGAVAKIATAFAHKHEAKDPQNVHFHVHQDNEGYHVGHTSSAWDDKIGRVSADHDMDQIESYNLYNKLVKNPYLRNYKYSDKR